MTLSSTLPLALALGNGIATEFAVGFKIFSEDALVVYSIDNDPSSETYREQTLLVRGTDYNVSGVGVASGCTVTFVSAPSALTALMFTSETSLSQETAYTGTAFPSAAHERALDMLTRMMQELSLRNNNSIRFPLQDGDDFDVELPPKAIRASKMFGFDENGDILMIDNLSPETVATLGQRIDDLEVIEPQLEADAAAAAAAAAAAESAQVAAEAAQAAVEAALPGVEAELSSLRADIAAEAFARAEGDAAASRQYLGNGWIDTLADADDVTLTNAAIDSGGISNAGADNAVTALDLTTAQFLDEKGSITTFTCDTANTSGHFNTAATARVKAGCRMVINGVSYPILSITGDGTAANSVVFAGTLTTGAKTLTAIHGCKLNGAALALSDGIGAATYSHALSSGDRTAHITVTASAGLVEAGTANNVVDGSTVYSEDNYIYFPVSLAVAGHYLSFQFDEAVCIKEVTVANYNSATCGTWKWQVHNGSAWVDVSAAADLGGTTSRVYSLSGNTLYATQYRLLGVSGNNASSGRNSNLEMTFSIAPKAYPTGVVYPLSLAVDCTDWTALKALARTETLNSQFIWYALSFDGGTTYSAFASSAWLPIVRNNAGTWQYWTGSAWSNAGGYNTALWAMVVAAGNVPGNRMTGATLAGLSQAQIEGSGGFTGGQTTIPVLATMYSTSTTATPVLSAMSMTSDIQPHDMVAEFDAFEATDPDMGLCVFVLDAIDDVTLDTDLKAWMKRGTGEYQQIDLEVLQPFDADSVLVIGEADMIAGTGTSTQFKLTSHNHKEMRIKDAANRFRSA